MIAQVGGDDADSERGEAGADHGQQFAMGKVKDEGAEVRDEKGKKDDVKDVDAVAVFAEEAEG